MFSKQSKEIKQSPNPEVENLEPKLPETIAFSSTEDEIQSETDVSQASTVGIVEKISGILSPYFIVLVGLYLYDDNFLFGTVLILIGIVSLLKISYSDLVKWFEDLKKFLGYDNPQ